MSLLELILASKYETYAVSQLNKGGFPVSSEARLSQCKCPFAASFLRETINIIGELKPRSPVTGKMIDDQDIDPILEAYKEHCVAVSVLTDEKFFGGSFDLLQRVVKRTGLPAMCKDFVICKEQIKKAQTAGASAILLIAKILEKERLHALFDAASEAGLEPVVEINDDSDLDKLPGLNCRVILINNRNLGTMQVDLSTTGRLARRVGEFRSGHSPLHIISASGIKSKDDIKRILPSTNNFLIGTAFMQAPEPLALLSQMKQVEALPTTRL